MRLLVPGVALSLVLACHAVPQRSERIATSPQEAEVYVYVARSGSSSDQLSIALESVAVVAIDGTEFPLEVAPAADVSRQRLVGSGPVAPGAYSAVVVRIRRVTRSTPEGTADLLVSAEPERLPAVFTADAGRATVLWLTPVRSTAPEASFAFSAAYTATVAPAPTIDVLGLVSVPERGAIFSVDTRAKVVTSVFRVGREPRGLAVDRVRGRIYVSDAAGDEIQVLDASRGDPLGRISLRPQDDPREMALVLGGRVLVAMNAGSFSLSFMDPDAFIETARVRTGEHPIFMSKDPSGSRLFVLTASPNGLAVVDVATQSVSAAVTLEAEPVWAAADRLGERLYVAYRDSPYVTVLALPNLTLINRMYVGGGATLLVDARTGLILVGQFDAARIELFDPLSLAPIDTISVVAPPSAMAIDQRENALFVLQPAAGAALVLDLTDKSILSRLDFGGEPFRLDLPAER